MHKIMIDWEDIDLSELLKGTGVDLNFDEDDDDGPRNIGEMLIDKYLEREHNFHILNTNFNLSNQRCRKIARIPGIERFTPLSRYKAMVNIAKLFDVNEVKEQVKVVINNFFYNNKLGQQDDGGELEGV